MIPHATTSQREAHLVFSLATYFPFSFIDSTTLTLAAALNEWIYSPLRSTACLRKNEKTHSPYYSNNYYYTTTAATDKKVPKTCEGRRPPPPPSGERAMIEKLYFNTETISLHFGSKIFFRLKNSC
jgi:hypothetical protein